MCAEKFQGKNAPVPETMVKFEIGNRSGLAVNIFKTTENTDFAKLSLKRSSSKSSQLSVDSSDEPRKAKACSTSESEMSEQDAKGSLKSDEEDSGDENSEKNKKLTILANLSEDTFLRRHELYVSDIEDSSSDVIFAIAPITR